MVHKQGGCGPGLKIPDRQLFGEWRRRMRLFVYLCNKLDGRKARGRKMERGET
jgi:hypothetical protein